MESLFHVIKTITNSVLHVIRTISVEPIGFLQFMSLSFNRMAALVFTLTAVCDQRYGDDPMVDCHNRTGDVQDTVQAEALKWITWTSVGAILPAIITNLILGKPSNADIGVIKRENAN